MISRNNKHPQKIIFFDGVCNLCESFVNFLIKRDKKKSLYFASLQSRFAREKLAQSQNSSDFLKSVVFLDGQKIYFQSSAALRILKELGGIYKLALIFLAIPKPIRDIVYKLIARYRYRLFGRKQECMIPTPELKSRFLDESL